MKYPALLLLAAFGCAPGIDLQAAETVEAATSAEKESALLTAAQLDELLAPIALYPDPLVAIILPASTFPADVVLAARYLKANSSPEAIDDQPWDDSVKALARYPEVVKWMDENLAWTRQLGAAFTVQPAAVLTGTQRLRAAAVAAGNLKDTPQQTIVVEKEVVRIVPAQPEVIYVPVYDPVWVYRPRPVHVYYPAPLITFSIGHRTGVWLSYGCDWGYNTVVVVNRPHRASVWHSYPICHYPRPVITENCHVWRPAPARVQIVRRDYERRADYRVSRPTPNVHVQRGPDRAAAPRAVAGAGSGAAAPSSRPVPAPAVRATSPTPPRDVRNPAVIAPRAATPGQSSAATRPPKPAPAVVRNESSPRPAATMPTNTRPERVRSTAPVQVAEARPRGDVVPRATSGARPERVHAAEPRPTLPSGSTRALPLPGMATSAEIEAARARR